MKAKILTRMNILLGAAIWALIGLSGCERQVKYGPDPELKYGVPNPEVTPEYGIVMPVEEETL